MPKSVNPPRHRAPVVVIGAGVAGLAAAIDLAAAGTPVRLFERAAAAGGKMRVVRVAGRALDAGPTVLTMRHVLDALCANAHTSLEDHVRLAPATILARHAWSSGERLDLFADAARSEQAVADFAGSAEAAGFRAFCAAARGVHATLSQSYIEAERPDVVELARRIGWHRLGALWRIRPFETLWQALGQYFRDPRLRQLFGRYATYCGSSPFAAPATLMLVAHVEQAGVWQVEGGMQRLAQALTAIARGLGAEVRCDAHVAAIEAPGGTVRAVRLADGERIAARAVVAAVDFAALAQGAFGADVAAAVPAVPPHERSLSALTWNIVGRAEGFALSHHNVFFGGDYRAEFDDVFGRGVPPADPTVYVCAQDRGVGDDTRGTGAHGEERFLCLVNAPPAAGAASLDAASVASCRQRMLTRLASCGLRIAHAAERCVVTTPTDFERLFPGSAGALYGPAAHGWRASFRRPGARTRIRGLFLAGGSVHPGPGVPLAVLSGRRAAAHALAETTERPA